MQISVTIFTCAKKNINTSKTVKNRKTWYIKKTTIIFITTENYNKIDL